MSPANRVCLMIFFYRKKGMSFEDFDKYWRETHAEVACALPIFQRNILKYEQVREMTGNSQQKTSSNCSSDSHYRFMSTRARQSNGRRTVMQSLITTVLLYLRQSLKIRYARSSRTKSILRSWLRMRQNFRKGPLLPCFQQASTLYWTREHEVELAISTLCSCGSCNFRISGTMVGHLSVIVSSSQIIPSRAFYTLCQGRASSRSRLFEPKSLASISLSSTQTLYDLYKPRFILVNREFSQAPFRCSSPCEYSFEGSKN